MYMISLYIVLISTLLSLYLEDGRYRGMVGSCLKTLLTFLSEKPQGELCFLVINSKEAFITFVRKFGGSFNV